MCCRPALPECLCAPHSLRARLPRGCWQVMLNARHDARLREFKFVAAGRHERTHRPRSLGRGKWKLRGVRHCAGPPFTEYGDYNAGNQILDRMSTPRSASFDRAAGQHASVHWPRGRPGWWLRHSCLQEIAWTNAGNCFGHAKGIRVWQIVSWMGLDRAATLAGAGLLAPVGV